MIRTQRSVLATAVAAAILGLSGAAQARLASAQEVSFTNPQGHTVPATLYRPVEPGPRPAVIILPGCERSAESGAATIVTLNSGFTYAVTENLQLDAGANIGVTDAADDLNVFVGMSQRF